MLRFALVLPVRTGALRRSTAATVAALLARFAAAFPVRCSVGAIVRRPGRAARPLHPRLLPTIPHGTDLRKVAKRSNDARGAADVRAVIGSSYVTARALPLFSSSRTNASNPCIESVSQYRPRQGRAGSMRTSTRSRTMKRRTRMRSISDHAKEWRRPYAEKEIPAASMSTRLGRWRVTTLHATVHGIATDRATASVPPGCRRSKDASARINQASCEIGERRHPVLSYECCPPLLPIAQEARDLLHVRFDAHPGEK